jgi:hypothetical protein
MTKDRLFDVELVDKTTGRKILSFKGLVSDKKQSSGKLGGDVREILFMNAWDIEIKGNLKNNVNRLKDRVKKNKIIKKIIKKKNN